MNQTFGIFLRISSLDLHRHSDLKQNINCLWHEFHERLFILLAAVAQLLQLCLPLCDLRDHRLPGSSVHGLLQARKLEWIAMPSYRLSAIPRGQPTSLCLLY